MKKITFIFALLCASVMGWAVDWTGQVTGSANNVWLDGISSDADRTPVVNYTVNYLMEYNGSALTVTIGFTDDNFGKTVGLVPQIFVNGAYKGNFSGNSWSSTDYSAGDELDIYFYFAYSGTPPNNVSASSHFNYTVPGGSTPAVTGICESAVYATDVAGYDIHAKVTKGANKYYLTLTSATDGKTLTGLSGDNMFCYQYGDESRTEAQRSGDFKMAQSGRYTISEGAITFTIPSVGDPQMYTNLDVIYSDNHVAHISALNGVRLVPCSTEDPVAYDPDPTEIEDVNFALFSNGAFAYASAVEGGSKNGKHAIDGNDGSAFSTAHSDPQWFIVDLGQRRIFNTIQIRWQTAYSRTFTIDVSNDGETWTTKKEENYYEGGDNVEYEVSLSENVTARYVRLYSTARATQWGNSFYSFRVLLKGVPVLTSVDLSSNTTIAKVGEYATLTPSPKDQNNGAIDASLSYTVTPADAGHVTDNKYYPEKYGLATITVTATTANAEVTSNSVEVWGVTSDNLALNKPSEAGYNPVNQGEINTKANDGDESTLWVTWENASVADEWWYVDLGTSYDITGINVSWGGDYSTNYILQVRAEAPSPDDKANDEAWTTLATVTTASANSSVFSQVTGTGRYVRFHSLSRSWWQCFRLRELQVFGSESATPTKSVSASVNDPAMGTATVKQNNADVTEVETGSTVTFSAVANEGYIFVEWSNGEKEATFNATVDAAMNLTATFRALGNIYCNTLVHSSNGGQEHDAYVTMKRSGENEYQLIVRAEYALGNFSNTEFRIKALNAAELSNYNLNNKGVLSADNHTLTGTIISTIEPEMISGKLYVNIVGQWEGQFDRLTNIEYSQPCADPEITAIALDKTEATLDMGNSLTLVPTFTPAYISAAIEWLTSDDAVATVANGVVTPIAPGTVTITAKISETVKATCAVTVQAAAPPTKSVSATPNDPAMGTANVKQLGADVTEVEAGTTVTFSAVANDGYIFVNWSNNETAATFDAEVNANMNLTANFRALNHISCNEEMTNGDYTVYVTYRKTANENEYEFIVRSAKEMTGFSNAYIGKINGNNQVNLNGHGSLTGNGHKLSYTFISTTEPKLNTPLYVNFANHGEVTFSQINNGTVFEFAVACADPEITAIALDKTEATLDMGNTLTLKPSFTPAYMSADIEWLTSDDAVATVANGVVTPVAPGTATITAKISETVKATCAITVQASTSHNWYGYGTSQDLDYTYRIEYTTDHHIVAHVKRQGAKTGLVNVGMNINNVWTSISVTEGEETGWKKGTTEATYTAGDNITIILQSNWAGPSSIVEFAYTVGADNEMPTIVPSVLKLSTTSMTMSIDDADVQLTTEIHHRDAANQTITWTSDDENVVTVENGLVHPVGVGSTTVRANTFNNVEATCTVTVVGVLEPTVFWGNGVDNGVSIAYSITRNTNHTLTYAVEALQDKTGFVVQVNDGDWHDATLNEGIYTWTSEATYTDGDVFSGFFYMPFSGGAARVDFTNYEVGSETARKYIPITLKDDDNNFVISASNNAIREVKLSRTFPNTDEWYTICLPFDLSDEQLTEIFGAGYTLAELIDSEDRGSLIHLNFDYAPAFTAGKAYLLRPGTGVTSAPTFNGVTVKNVTPIVSGDDLMHFQGTFNLITLDQDNQRFVGPENYLYSPAANGTNMKAFRCFFTIPDGPQQNNVMGKRARIVFGPQETTDIDLIDQEPNTTGKLLINGQLYIIRDGKTYNAQGMLVK